MKKKQDIYKNDLTKGKKQCTIIGVKMFFKIFKIKSYTL